MERERIYASAYKRLALLAADERRAADLKAAMQEMRTHYEEAKRLGTNAGANDVFYPAMNCVLADLALANEKQKFDVKQIQALRKNLASKAQTDPDFWSVVGQTEMDVYEAVAQRTLAHSLPAIIAALKSHHQHVSEPWMWASVYDTARLVLPMAARSSAAEKKAANDLLRFLKHAATQT
jgi:hypothetical protein